MINESLLPLLSKQGQVAIKLARLLLSHQPGDKLVRIQDYAAMFEMGTGTIQAALNYIQDVGAVQLEARGQLGTFIREINYPLLWSITGQGYIVGEMPLPYSRRYEGLATGLLEAFKSSGLELTMVFSRGAMNRLRALLNNRCDMVVMSRFAFNQAIKSGLDIGELLSLGAETYVGKHVIFLKDPAKDTIENGMRVGIDPQSIDQVSLAKAACSGKDVQFIEISYMNLVAALEKGQIDAALWNNDDFTAQHLPFKTVDLPDLGSNGRIPGDNTEAVIAVKKESLNHLKFLRAILNKQLICDIQQKVMDKKMFPSY